MRGKIGRMRAAKQRDWWADRRKKEEWAALLVQRHIRGLFGRRVLQRLQQDEETRHQAALWIQSRWRARKGRMAAHLVLAARRSQMEERSAIMVQAAWRAKKGRFAAFLLQRAKAVRRQQGASGLCVHARVCCTVLLHGVRLCARADLALAAEIDSAVMLQRIARGRQGRKVAQSKRAQRTLHQLKQHDLFSWGAVTVQKTFRGYVRALVVVVVA